MTRLALIAITVASLVTLNLPAQEVCPCIPQPRIWTSVICDTWNCASSALVSANGDPTVFAVPFGMKGGKWLLIRQVHSGGFIDNSPMLVEPFDEVGLAAARLASIRAEFRPLIVSAPDGKLLVLSLKEPERRWRTVQ